MHYTKIVEHLHPEWNMNCIDWDMNSMLLRVQTIIFRYKSHPNEFYASFCKPQLWLGTAQKTLLLGGGNLPKGGGGPRFSQILNIKIP